MSDTRDKHYSIDKLVTQQPESTDPAYLAWKKKKIRSAIKRADDNPDDVLTEKQIWNKFGLDR